MSILDKLGDVSRGASDKAKSISEANNLKRKILYEEDRIGEIFGILAESITKAAMRILRHLKLFVTILMQESDVSRR